MPSQIQEEAVRWNIKVSRETNLSLPAHLGAQGMKKGDLSKFVEDAVRWRVFHRTVQEIKTRNANTLLLTEFHGRAINARKGARVHDRIVHEAGTRQTTARGRYHEGEVVMPQLDWSQCPAVESIPGKVSGAWVLKGTRMPVQTIFENLEAGLSVKEITEVFDVTEREVKAVLHFAAQSLEKAPAYG